MLIDRIEVTLWRCTLVWDWMPTGTRQHLHMAALAAEDSRDNGTVLALSPEELVEMLGSESAEPEYHLFRLVRASSFELSDAPVREVFMELTEAFLSALSARDLPLGIACCCVCSKAHREWRVICDHGIERLADIAEDRHPTWRRTDRCGWPIEFRKIHRALHRLDASWICGRTNSIKDIIDVSRLSLDRGYIRRRAAVRDEPDAGKHLTGG